MVPHPPPPPAGVLQGADMRPLANRIQVWEEAFSPLAMFHQPAGMQGLKSSRANVLPDVM